MKDRTIRDIKTLFEQQEVGYYNWVRADNFWHKNYIEYESSGEGNKNLSVKEYHNEINPT